MSLLIIDALNIIRRIHEAIAVPDGEATVADTLKSGLSSFKRALKTHRPTHAVAVFDHGGRTWKHELYEGYQANRKAMAQPLRDGLPTLQHELNEMGLHWISIEGIEADDAIATLVEKWCKATSEQTIILSTDKDFLQLLSAQVCIYDHFKDLWRDAAYVQAKFAVMPSQMGDLLALMGDAVDGVPGVDKVGRKTAARLLRINGNLDRLIANADKVGGQVGVNLRKGMEIARLSRQLVSFKTDRPLGLTWKMLAQVHAG
ncbi:MAG: 5'-3' exonuclease [Gammaproteobacteria bacterium]|uniref:5'-3' exonuclease H3TH domain-containing protein n=1 Tax=Rhodoferax sp. TaxID=50421 RepID=UPI0017F23D95|nr:5'-3' exonuclease H3TH domain-containing protein [Rhodoferax sp.]MBU3900604.1 5'-3' exonuclease [Gammaproteobacteria bacterium]MBA3059101.1 5'-3' exonuclease [Rhodoferax sp.]MBU3996733.1 5'-3' exonuclease [Gammaproteobacteria bacterium]MBU4081020.1 5'-3' exonuclease [Gammaproteobacteria bacterium]MBU4112087.1 5'-3' exonuclease [Gammaproteobacteria bacterium]